MFRQSFTFSPLLLLELCATRIICSTSEHCRFVGTPRANGRVQGHNGVTAVMLMLATVRHQDTNQRVTRHQVSLNPANNIEDDDNNNSPQKQHNKKANNLMQATKQQPNQYHPPTHPPATTPTNYKQRRQRQRHPSAHFIELTDGDNLVNNERTKERTNNERTTNEQRTNNEPQHAELTHSLTHSVPLLYRLSVQSSKTARTS